MASNEHSSALPPPVPLSSLEEWLKLPKGRASSSLIRTLDPKPYVEDFWKQRTRPDGRLLAQGRPTKVVMGILKHSTGSALVQHQPTVNDSENSVTTKIIAATTIQIGQPSPQSPEEGEIIVQISGTGGRNLGSDFGKSTRTYQNWDVLQSWLQRSLKEDQISSTNLNLLTGKACVRLIFSVIILEDGGNVKDMCLLACMAAYSNTKLPQIGKDLQEVHGKLYWKSFENAGEMTISITQQQEGSNDDSKDNIASSTKIRNYRISLSMGIWKNPITKTTELIVDPSSEEEPHLHGLLTIVISLMTGKLKVDYTGKVALTATDLALASKMAKGRAEELSRILS